VLAAVGLLGKILGPAGWLLTVYRGELPARTFPLILCNDLVWWLPFGWYLIWMWCRSGRDHRPTYTSPDHETQDGHRSGREVRTKPQGENHAENQHAAPAARPEAIPRHG
jgi:hypothetical protein